MDLELAGKTALITGASQGLGLAIARTLAREGCHLHLAARNRPALEAAKAALEAARNVTVGVHAVDLSASGAVEALAAEAGEVDILVNNAGDIPTGPLTALSETAIRAGFDLKLFGYINLTRLVYPRMKARGGGVVINVIGAAGENWNFNYVAGSTANAALMSFTKAVGGGSLDDGIRVVGINPGLTATARMEKMMRRRALDTLGDEARWPELMSKLPGGRAGKPEEIADLAAFLASPRSGYTTGTIVTVDGGASARGR